MATPPQMITLPEPPAGGFTVDDLRDLDYLGHHVELISGGLYVNARPSTWHMSVVLNLWRRLAEQSPAEYRVLAEQGVRVEDGTSPEPDVLAVRAEAVDPDAYTYLGRDVVLAVEVVSPGSERRDRHDKPALYAEAGVAHYWRVEREGVEPVVHVYELDPTTATYVATGIHRQLLDCAVPWQIAINLDGLYP